MKSLTVLTTLGILSGACATTSRAPDLSTEERKRAFEVECFHRRIRIGSLSANLRAAVAQTNEGEALGIAKDMIDLTRDDFTKICAREGGLAPNEGEVRHWIEEIFRERTSLQEWYRKNIANGKK